MDKKIFYIVLVLLLSFSCEDVYHPNLDQVENQIVIEALVTNDISKNFVKISRSRNFYDKDIPEMISGGTVELIDNNGQTYQGVESGTGNFSFDHIALPGEEYQLKVTAEGETYESDFEVMPSVPTFDSLYAESEQVTNYRYSTYGEPIAYVDDRIHTYIDLPVRDSLSNYRFIINKTLEYIIPPPPSMGNPPTVYGWLNYVSTGNFNIVEPAKYGTGDIIRRHSLIILGKGLEGHLPEEVLQQDAYLFGWVINVNEYGLSGKTFNYYKAMYDQLEASGKLFDAVYAQLVPNIKCVSNPGKNVLGYFELSSYHLTQFFTMSHRGSKTAYSRILDEIKLFPPSNTISGYTPPDFWVSSYN